MLEQQQEERTWGVLAYVMADQAFLSLEDAANIDGVAKEEAKKLVRAARGLDDMYLAVHVDLTETTGSLRYQVPTQRTGPEERQEGRAGVEGLITFLEEAKKALPAKYYMVILWGHGSGPLGLFDDPSGGGAGDTGHLTLRDLHTVLSGLKEKAVARGRKQCAVDILLVKSCYMATLEAACEIDTLADYMICSQARVPLRTWTIWEDVFEVLTRQQTPEAAAIKMLAAIDQHYRNVVERNDRAEVPFSLLRPAGIRERMGELVALVSAITRHRNDTAVMAAIEGARPDVGGDKALLDLRTLCANLINLERADLSEFAVMLDEVLKPAVVIDNVPVASRFGGVGVFLFPSDPLLRTESFANEVPQTVYCNLDFPRLTGWGDLAFPWPLEPAAEPAPAASVAGASAATYIPQRR